MAPADRAAIEAFLRRAPYLHAYALGDLDPRETAHTTWIAGDPVDAVLLIYRGLSTPTILGLADDNPAAIACHRGVGFEICHRYDEWRVTRRAG